ncbi:hypothetical protein BGZ79_005982 [Entomortierella chlamydospora]|nr:hypothetical protein BGZ79_005982 [Entomortierella chlamydospora]
MSQPPMTYRPLDEDEDAPPPYEATAPATVAAAQTAPTATIHQQYPVLHLDGTMSGPPPPSMNYYPAMATAPSFVTAPATAAPHSEYPSMTSSITYNPPYPATPLAYPTMPVHSLASPYPLSYPNTQVLQPEQHQPSAPFALIEDPVPSPPTTHQSTFEEAVTLQDSEDIQHKEQDLINLNDWPSPGATTAVLTPPSSTTSTMAAPAIELVTSYRCKKCGAILESETAACKRLHTPATILTERQIRNAINIDQDERTRNQIELVSPSSSSATLGRQRSNSGSTGSSNSLRVDRYENNHGTNDIYLRRRSHGHELTTAVQTIPSIENNYGTNSTYIRRSISVQTPVTALKKFWRDAKKEVNYKITQSQQRSVQPEIVAPPPLPYPIYQDTTSLNRSNTYAGSSTPAYNPSHAPSISSVYNPSHAPNGSPAYPVPDARLG